MTSQEWRWTFTPTFLKIPFLVQRWKIKTEVKTGKSIFQLEALSPLYHLCSQSTNEFRFLFYHVFNVLLSHMKIYVDLSAVTFNKNNGKFKVGQVKGQRVFSWTIWFKYRTSKKAAESVRCAYTYISIIVYIVFNFKSDTSKIHISVYIVSMQIR